MKIPFYKMSGCGNDFIIIDNRTSIWDTLMNPDFVKTVCKRKTSVGADGMIFILSSEKTDFAWRFYNSDGSRAEMCGNGARCAALYAFLNNIAPEKLSFETEAGIINAEIKGKQVRVQLKGADYIQSNINLVIDRKNYSLYFLNTGVPHVVCFMENVDTFPVKDIGSQIRFHDRFKPAGTNVNFVEIMPDITLSIRTYERGVEDETLACGTGAVAAALVAVATGKSLSPVQVKTKSSEIITVITEYSSAPFKKVFMEGGVRVVCEAHLWWSDIG